jgi:lipopolysaccharide export system protein LptA
VPKGGGVATRIEATGDEADLNPPTRTLVLRGNVDGFYQVGNGVRTTLAGTEVTIDAQKNVRIKGPVKLIVPPEPAANNAAAIGTVTVTSRDARFDQKSGEVHFVGEAHAVSTDGPNKFDVAAPEMVLTRGDGNTIDTLRTVGRTRLKIDLPPDPPKPTTSTPATPATPVGPATPATPAAGETKIGKPTHVEVEADAATVNRKTNTMTFEGNVIGFYNLAPAGEQAQRYDFTGNKAIIKYIPDAQASTENPAGLKADITGTKGKPVEVETPAFNLDLSG